MTDHTALIALSDAVLLIAESKSELTPVRRQVLRRAATALAVPVPTPDERIKVSISRTDQGFGYDRWVADQYSCGQGEPRAILLIYADKETRDAVFEGTAQPEPECTECGDYPRGVYHDGRMEWTECPKCDGPPEPPDSPEVDSAEFIDAKPEPSTVTEAPTTKTIRQAARDREPLDGTDAQALEGALVQVERDVEAFKAALAVADQQIKEMHEDRRVGDSQVLDGTCTDD